ncbi:DUF4097 domain-containing protein [Paenibacillus thiaminolyticus]|uniref:DUF4097 domain-containing protein n=1 Tax=Paenibacillus thiaminolyticus TaxID=49283 RepID=A0AAP9DXZ4_PANTH|nr:DUF4097 family beta strand repeat-containing protein [Paenibacillus thiaminolyticus]MCY9536609.1 DUF4097 domain-containing protein [Paenibacillus thiaminolyticus]MCY9603848.1 DUF4097 domain-containing protein [Paenibacillus thiaminolyticus]MCY9609952.1 DUF4097 domain-containing protein [Paenibacillus thiaminolyticus]MCY9612894.1 DUF4097 domain-containing protein [Paenibacillus thiaminolyticus]MCY9618406.1 DUF4097 domain-containing protein [Paenibacillus thiaminolyticus]
MIKVGRITAALLIIAVGVMVLVDQFFGLRSIRLLLVWWPFIFVLWGLEMMVSAKRGRSPDGKRSWKIDWLGMFAAIFLSVSVFMIVQPYLFRDWVRSIQFDFSMMKEMKLAEGMKFKQSALNYSIEGRSIRELAVRNRYGNVSIRSGNVADVVVEPTVIVSSLPKEEAQQLADQSLVDIAASATEHRLRIEGTPARYAANKELVRIDLSITVPDEVAWNLHVQLDDGLIDIRELRGAIAAETKSGSIQIANIDNSVQARTWDGDIVVKGIGQDLNADTARGDIIIHDIKGDVTADTKSGAIDISRAVRAVQAETLSGDVLVESEVVGGYWKLLSLAGDMTIHLPDDANATVFGRNTFGDITSDYPLDIADNRIEGTLGSGMHDIVLQTNGDLHVLRR